MDRVVKLEVLSGHRLFIEFDDGVRGEVDLSERLVGPVFEPLRNPELFALARIDDFGVVCWPNGADLAPDALYERLCERAEVDR